MGRCEMPTVYTTHYARVDFISDKTDAIIAAIEEVVEKFNLNDTESFYDNYACYPYVIFQNENKAIVRLAADYLEASLIKLGCRINP